MAKKEIRYGIGFDVNKQGLEEIKKELRSIQTMSEAEFTIKNPKVATDKIRSELGKVQETAKQVETALEKSFNPKLDSISLHKFQQELKGIDLKTISTEFQKAGDSGKKAFSDLTSTLMTTKRQLKESVSWVDKLGETFTNTIRWKIASGGIDAVTRSISNAWNYAKRLDTSLNDIRIVTGKSADEMDRFAKKANQAAKNLGATTTNYTKAALIYYQQGLGEEDVQARANVTVKAANVTGQSAAEVSEQLTAVWNGYKVVAREAELYVDKLAAVAASTAADLEELSEGMSKVASAASTMGVDIDQLSAQLSTIISVTRQDANVVGTALKTIYARMGDLEVDGVDEFGTSLGDVSGKLKQMGIDVLDQEGNLRDMGSVIEEVAAKWGTWTDAQQQAAAVAIAGKRQYNNLIALFENWDMYESALTTSQNSKGTLQKQQDIYMDSIEAHLNKLTASAESFYDALIDNDAFKGFIDFLSGALNVITKITESMGGLLPMIGALAPMFAGSIGKKLGEGVSTIWGKISAQKYNKKELAAEAALNQGLSTNENAIAEEKKWIALKEKQLKYASVLSTEEINKGNERLAQIAEEIKKIKERNQLMNDAIGIEESDSYAANLTENTSEIDQLKRIADKRVKSIEDIGKDREKALDDLNRTEIEIQHLQALNSGDKKDSYRAYASYGISGLTKDSTQEEIDKAAFLKITELEEKKKQQENQLAKLSKEEENFLDSKEKAETRLAQLGVVRDENGKFQDPDSGLAKEKTQLQTELDKIKNTQKTLENLNSGDKKDSYLAYGSYGISGLTKNSTQEEIDKAAQEKIKELEEKSKKLEEKIAAIEVEEKVMGEGFENVSPEERVKLGRRNIEKATGATNNLKNFSNDIKEIPFTRSKQDLEKAQEAWKKYSEELKKCGLVSNDVKAKIAALDEQMKTMTESTEAASEEQANSFQAGMQEIIDSVEDASEKEEEFVQGLEETLAENEQSTQQINNDSQAFAEDYDKSIEKVIQTGTKFVASIGSIISAVSMLQNAGNIWNNDDLSTGEKIVQTLPIIFSLLMMGIPIIKIAAAAWIKAEKAKQKENYKTATSTLLTLGIIGMVIAALVGLVAIFAALGNTEESALEKSQKHFEAMKKEAEEANQRVKDLNSEYNNLLGTISKYRDAKTALEDMRVGTEEWKKATEDLNNQVWDLVQQYPELLAMGAVDFSGDVYSISQEGFDAITQNKQQQLAQARSLSAIKQMNVARASSELTRANFKDKYFDTSVEKDGSFGMQYRAIEIQNLTEFLKGQDIDVKNLESLTDEQLLNLDESIKNLSEEDLELLGDDITNLCSDIRNAQEEINRNTVQEKALTEQLALSIAEERGVADKQAYKNLTTEKNVFSKDSQNAAKGSFLSKYFDLGASGWSTEKGTFNNSSNLHLVIDTNKEKTSGNINETGEYVYWEEEQKLFKEMATDLGQAVFGNSFTLAGAGLTDEILGDTKTSELFDVKLLKWEGSSYSLNDLLDIYAKNKLESTGSAKEIEDTINALNAKGYSTSASYFSGSSSYGTLFNEEGGATLGQYDELIGTDLSGKELSYKDENGNVVKTKIDKNYLKNVKAGQNDFIDKANADLDKFSENSYEATDNIFKSFTSKDFSTFSDNFAKAVAVGGQQGKEAFTNIFDSLASDPVLAKEVNFLMSTVNWTDAASVNEFTSKLIEMGVITDENRESWFSFTKDLHNGMSLWISDSRKVIENLKTIKEVAEELKVGDIVSEEDFKSLTKIAPEVAENFIKTAEGYKLLTSGNDLNKKLKDQYKNLDDIEKKYAEIKSAASKFGSGSTSFNPDAFENSGIANIKNFFNNDTIALANALDSENGAKIQQWIETLRTTDSKSTEYTTALDLLGDMASSINQAASDAANGEYSIGTAREIYISSIADSWSEIVASGIYKGSEEYKKGKTMWKNTYLAELGLELSQDIVESLDIYELENAVVAARQLELDMLVDINAKLEEANFLADILFGEDKYNKLKESIELSKDAEEVAQIQANNAKEVFGTVLNSNLTEDEKKKYINEDGSFNYIQFLKEGLKYDENGKLDSNSQAILDSYDTLNAKTQEALEASYGIIDAQIAAYEYTLEMKDKFFEMKETMREISNEFKEFVSGDLDVFGEKNIADLIDEAFEKIPDLSIQISDNLGELENFNAVEDLKKEWSEEVENYQKNYSNEALNNQRKSFEDEYNRILEERENKKIQIRNSIYNNDNYRQWEAILDNPYADANKKWAAEKAISSMYGGIKKEDWLSKSYQAKEINEEYEEKLKQAEQDIKNIELEFEKNKQNAWKEIVEDDKGLGRFFTIDSDSGEIIFNEQAFSEGWEEAISKTHESFSQMKETLQELYDGYLQAQEELIGLYDKEIEKLSSMNSILSNSAELWKIVGKTSESYNEKINTYYGSIVTNTKTSYDFAYAQLQTAQIEYEKIMALGEKASKEMIDTVTTNLTEAQEKVLSSSQEWLTAIVDGFSSSMGSAIDTFFEQVQGMDLAEATENWQLEISKDERYLDEVNSAYAEESLYRQIQSSIDETDSIVAQNKLMQARLQIEKELTEAKEAQGKLTQYDLDRANAMYELTLKQIALEEAQQTANKMKLTRDAMGNYSYQYVADENAIAKAEEELAAAENNLYNIDKDRTKTLVSDYYSTWSEAQTALAEAARTGDQERVQRVYDYYFGENGLLSGMKAELGIVGDNFENMTSSWKTIVDEINNSEAFNMEELFSGLNETLFDSENGAITQLNELLSSDSSPLVVATKSLTEALKNPEDLANEVTLLQDKTLEVLSQLPGLTEKVGAYSTALTSLGNKYTDWIKEQGGDALTMNSKYVEENTSALKELTQATLESLDKMDDDEINGSIGNVGRWQHTGDENGWQFIAENET